MRWALMQLLLTAVIFTLVYSALTLLLNATILSRRACDRGTVEQLFTACEVTR